MIRLQINSLSSVDDAKAMLQTAIGVEFGTLPPYLYALYSNPPGKNPQATERIKSIVLNEMVHMCLDCNILNALGGSPVLTPPTYPGPLPGDIGPDGERLTIHLLPFSEDAMKQGMAIETPEDEPDYPIRSLNAATSLASLEGKAVTIGQFYQALDLLLKKLLPEVWKRDQNQIGDEQFFTGQLFPVNEYDDAHRAIDIIISEGEGTGTSPLSYQEKLAHYFLFGELFHRKVLTRTPGKEPGYQWGPARLAVDFAEAYPAIADPGTFDFADQPLAVKEAQARCNTAYTGLVKALQTAVTGGLAQGQLGDAVRAMFDLRTAALHAFTVPLANGKNVAGPAFLYQP
jgi:hypothetical protein